MTDLHFTAKLEGLLSGDTIELAEMAYERIAKTAEVGTSFHLFCEDITGIAFAGHMENFYDVILNPFMDSIVPKSQVASSIS